MLAGQNEVSSDELPFALLTLEAPMHTSFEEYESLFRDQVAAVIEAELVVDSARADALHEFIRRGRVSPRLIACQPTRPKRDPSPLAMEPMWLVFEVLSRSRGCAFVAYDSVYQLFWRGEWESETPWCHEGSSRFVDLVEQLRTERGA